MTEETNKPPVSFSEPEPRPRKLPIKSKHAKRLLGGVAVLAFLGVWPLVFGGGSADKGADTAPVTSSTDTMKPPPAAATSASASSVKAVADTGMQAAPMTGAAEVERGWVARSFRRADDNNRMTTNLDLMANSRVQLASWVDAKPASKQTDHLAYFPSRGAYLPAGHDFRGYWKPKTESDKLLYVQLTPPREYNLGTSIFGDLYVKMGKEDHVLTHMCAVRVKVDGKTVIDEPRVKLTAGSPEPVLVASKTPMRMSDTYHAIERWSQCTVISQWSRDVTVPGQKYEDEPALGVELGMYGSDAAEAQLGVEVSLWEGDAGVNGRRLISGKDVVHYASDEPKATPGIKIIPSVGSGALENGWQLGMKVDAIAYGENWRTDDGSRAQVASFFTDPSSPTVISSTDYSERTGKPLGGPFVYIARGVINASRDGHWYLGTAARNNPTQLPRNGTLGCATRIEVDGKLVVDEVAQVTDTNSGVAAGGIDLTKGEHVLVTRLACMVKGAGGLKLDSRGMFDNNEQGVTWRLIAYGPDDAGFRPLAKDEVYLKP